MIYLQSTANFQSHGIKCLVYGAAKVGKTRLLATAPSPVIFSAEGGLLSLRNFNLPYVEIHTMFELIGAFQWVTQSAEAKQFETIGLDSISEIMEVLLESEKAKTRDPRKAYGEIITQGLKLIRDFRDIPNKNVVMTAKQEFSKDESNGMFFYQPSFPGQKLGPALPYYPDEIFQYCIFQDQQTRKRIEALRCWPDQQNVAGDRSGSLNEFEEPHLGKIFAKIQARK